MKKILIINGPNLNMIGLREPELYGRKTYKDLKKYLYGCAKKYGVKITVYQSNEEGKIVTKIQRAKNRYDGLIVNAGAYTHTSIAILDALKAVSLKTVEVHLTDIFKREDYRKVSYVGEYAQKSLIGMGFLGYEKAIEFLALDL